MDNEQPSDEDSESDFSISMSDSDNEEFDWDTSEEYDPEGVTSGDDEGRCCHRSKEHDNTSQYEIIPDEYVPGNGHLLELLDDDTKPHDVMDDMFILSCIEATNEHGANNPNFVNKIGEITTDEKGNYFVHGFFAIRWHIDTHRWNGLGVKTHWNANQR